MQILIVEDSVDDALLLLAELEDKGYSVVHRCVETAADYVDALRTRSWDAIISDYSLPGFSGREALRLLREQNQLTPFIMVSSVHGEEHAAAMMRAGANDYLTKHSLFRLVPALEREWDAAQTRRQQKYAEAAAQCLATAANQFNRLHDLLPACSACHRIRDDKQFWQQAKSRLFDNTENIIPTSLCPDCAEDYERQLDFKDKLSDNHVAISSL